jgi:outer membrane protein assembly factor BamD (BamD/ComL family)
LTAVIQNAKPSGQITTTPGMASGRRWRRLLLRWAGCCLLPLSLLGCQGLGEKMASWQPPDTSLLEWTDLTKPWGVELPPPPQEAVYRAGHWDKNERLEPGTVAGDCASAKVLYQEAKYDDAGKVFHWVAARAEKEKNLDVLEDALFYEAECLYRERHYPKARDTYAKLLKNFPTSKYRSEAVQRQYEIAEYWTEDTRAEMAQHQEVKDGKRWFILPALFHWDREKPFFDEEGFATKTFETVYAQDPGGPLGAHALYRAGGINFFRERYDMADLYYSLLVEQYPRSPLAPAAMELAIQSKINLVGGPDYDGRKLAEARQLVDTALRSFPELREKEGFLNRTMFNINEQQAAKDYGTAEFYRRTKRPGAAYFYYEVVRRRYQGTPWAEKALARIQEIRGEVEAQGK